MKNWMLSHWDQEKNKLSLLTTSVQHCTGDTTQDNKEKLHIYKYIHTHIYNLIIGKERKLSNYPYRQHHHEPSVLWKRPQRALVTLLRHEDIANSPSSMNREVAIIRPQVCQPPELWEIKLFCLSHPIYDNLPKWTKTYHAFCLWMSSQSFHL